VIAFHSSPLASLSHPSLTSFAYDISITNKSPRTKPLAVHIPTPLCTIYRSAVFFFLFGGGPRYIMLRSGVGVFGRNAAPVLEIKYVCFVFYTPPACSRDKGRRRRVEDEIACEP
jgi:hypothetical protein